MNPLWWENGDPKPLIHRSLVVIDCCLVYKTTALPLTDASLQTVLPSSERKCQMPGSMIRDDKSTPSGYAKKWYVKKLGAEESVSKCSEFI